MKWQELLELLRGEVVFRSSLLLSSGETAPSIRRQIGRWVATGRLEPLRKGVYAVASPYRARSPHPFAVAGLLRPGSYVSLQSALAHYGLIPEHVPAVTSVTTGRPETLDTPLGAFIFRHIAKRLFRGYEAVTLSSAETAFVALPEKALLDTVHLTPRGHRRAFLDELRLQNLGILDTELLRRFADQAASAKQRRAVGIIIRLIGDGDSS